MVGEGWHKAAVGAGLSAGHARATLFIREDGDSDIKHEVFVNKNLEIIDSWGANEAWDASFITTLDPGEYEVGIRVSLSGKNFSVSAAVCDFYTDDGLDNQFPGFADSTYIALYEL